MKCPTPSLFITIAAACASLLGIPAVHAAAPVQRPNFIFIMGEGQGWTSTSAQMDDRLPNSKGDMVTPNLQKLAEQGMRFSLFYAPSPRCTPSRAAYFTGKSPAQLHMTFVGEGKEGGGKEGKGGGKGGKGGKGGGKGEKDESFSETGSRTIPPNAHTDLPPEEVTIAEMLKSAGYASAHFGKWHVGRADPATQGYTDNDGANSNGGPDNSNNPNPKQTHLTAQRGIAFMEKQVKAGVPFYLQVDQYAGRREDDASPQTVQLMRDKFGIKDEKRLGPAAADYEIDLAVGKILDRLQSLGIADKTYVIYTADHGTPGRNPPLNNGKGTVWEGGLRVPLLIRGPGVKAGAFCHVRTVGVDLFSTIAELAGVKNLPANLEGGSLVKNLTVDPNAPIKRSREEYVIHFPHYDKDDQGPASAIYLGQYKLMRVYDTNTRRLFDLSKDMSEQNDLASQMPDKVAELDKRMTEYLKAVNAQMPTPNPKFDPKKAVNPTAVKGKGKKGGK